MPTPNSAWPPKPFDQALSQIALHDAWYVGDTDGLTRSYTSGTHTGSRPSQRAGGVVGAVARFFWGRPQPLHSQRTRLHVPLASDIATASADLIFSEPPRLVLPRAEGSDQEHPAQDRLDLIFNNEEVHSTLVEAAELASAHGGVFLRIVWDTAFASHPILSVVSSDAAIPEWRFGRLAAVTFWNTVSDTNGLVLRHMERHEPGFIVHGLYQGSADNVGTPIPLEESPATAWLVGTVDANSAVATGSTLLTAAFVPNMLPQRRWRKIRELAPLGRSDFDGIEGTFDAIDETWSSWMRDVRLGKARVFVDPTMLESMGPGAGAYFDDDQELFTQLGSGVGSAADGDPSITSEQFLIRWQEHSETLRELVHTAARGAGLSVGTLGEQGEIAQETATKVRARERLSDRTRDKKIRYWKAGLTHIAAAMLEVDNAVFGANKSVPGEVPEARFTEQANQDPADLAQTIALLAQAEAVSTEIKVRMFHPDWEAEQVAEEVDRINDERTQAAAVDPFAYRPGVDDAPPEQGSSDEGE